MKVRDKYPVIVGGGVATQKWADEEGADGWGAQAKDGVDLARGILKVAWGEDAYTAYPWCRCSGCSRRRRATGTPAHETAIKRGALRSQRE
jgi:hypothetical protein